MSNYEFIKGESIEHLLTLAHEMTHLKQFARLQLRNYDNGRTKWKGEVVGRKRERKIGHRRLPWEVEAYRMQGPITKLFMKDMNYE